MLIMQRVMFLVAIDNCTCNPNHLDDDMHLLRQVHSEIVIHVNLLQPKMYKRIVYKKHSVFASKKCVDDGLETLYQTGPVFCLKRLSEWEDVVHRVTSQDWLFLSNSSSVSTLYSPLQPFLFSFFLLVATIKPCGSQQVYSLLFSIDLP